MSKTGPYWGILGLLPSRISILSATAPFPGPEDIKTVFIFAGFLVLQALFQAPQWPRWTCSIQRVLSNLSGAHFLL